ncbi:MAG: putative aminohydrolase SsnA [Firmicutes bacterium]|nr:putative aminohydrolase SsnA [Bacillota bacterium]
MLVGNGILITMEDDNRFFPDGAVLVEGEVVKEVGTTGDLRARHPEEPFLDARGMLILPGLVTGHTHLYGHWARGIPGRGEPAANFRQILERLWWRLDRALTPEDNYHQSLAALLEAVRHGVTTLFDHHASPCSCPGSLDRVAAAFTEVGLRGCLCYEVSDRDGPAIARQGLEENRRFAERCRREGGSLLRAAFGLHASFTVGEETLRLAAEIGHGLGVGFHVHVAEGEADVAETLRMCGKHPVRRLAEAGVLGEKSIAAHCVLVGPEEIRILWESGCTVAHNPVSNMNNAVGISPVPDLLEAGVNVVLGGDGFLDLWREMNLAAMGARLARRDPRAMGGEEVRGITWVNNARLARRYWDRPLGQITEGGYADLILLDYRPPTPLDRANYMGHLIYGVAGAAVDTVMVGGRLIMRGRSFQTVDEEAVLARSRELARSLWERY